MRIALVTHVRSIIGGTETYIDLLASGLHAAGHDVALWHEVEGPPDRGFIALSAGAPMWSVEDLGERAALRALDAWSPDVIYSHGVSTPRIERELLALAPAVMFAHAYHGACISGGKSRLSPSRTPCPRPLGVPCLLHYFPRRCGGLNPLTMARRYTLETGRRDMLGEYAAILTASTHMRNEYLKYGLSEDQVRAVGLMIPQAGAAVEGGSDDRTLPSIDLEQEWRLLFISRLTSWKGGDLLLRALPLLRSSRSGPVTLTVAGDGPERPHLEREAKRICEQTSGIDVRFVGWLGPTARSAALASAHLLVVPSVWPEPFGLVGPEAGLFRVPAAAFRVGGIPDWLTDGVNGHLADGDPPSSRGLADAITRSLLDPVHHAHLRRGALAAAREVSLERHLPRVLPILADAATRRRNATRAS